MTEDEVPMINLGLTGAALIKLEADLGMRQIEGVGLSVSKEHGKG